MGTDPSELYTVIAQMAVVIAGFGGLASGLGQREGGDDAKVDAMRLGVMLSASLSAAILGLMPATLDSLFGDGRAAVRVSAGLGLVAMLAYAPVSVRRAAQIRGAAGWSRGGTIANSACTLVAFVAFALSALGIPAGKAPALFLLGLLALLCSSIVMFSRVMASMLRPHRPDAS